MREMSGMTSLTNGALLSQRVEANLPIAVANGPHLTSGGDLDERGRRLEFREPSQIDAVAVLQDSSDKQLPILERRFQLDALGPYFDLDNLRAGREFLLGLGAGSYQHQASQGDSADRIGRA
jgi:hypothetical protein